jgi:carbonic anhydrase
MDFRLTERIREWLKQNDLMGDCDIVAIAGSAKDIVDGSEGERNHLLKQIEISEKLHHATKVILMNHTQCGAYAGSYKFASEDEEIAQHTTDLKKAEEIIQAKFPNMEVIKVIAEMKDGEGKEVDFRKL